MIKIKLFALLIISSLAYGAEINNGVESPEIEDETALIKGIYNSVRMQKDLDPETRLNYYNIVKKNISDPKLRKLAFEIKKILEKTQKDRFNEEAELSKEIKNSYYKLLRRLNNKNEAANEKALAEFMNIINNSYSTFLQKLDCNASDDSLMKYYKFLLLNPDEIKNLFNSKNLKLIGLLHVNYSSFKKLDNYFNESKTSNKEELIKKAKDENFIYTDKIYPPYHYKFPNDILDSTPKIIILGEFERTKSKKKNQSKNVKREKKEHIEEGDTISFNQKIYITPYTIFIGILSSLHKIVMNDFLLDEKKIKESLLIIKNSLEECSE
jgi:ASC-1-like (ASCH) protein